MYSTTNKIFYILVLLQFEHGEGFIPSPSSSTSEKHLRLIGGQPTTAGQFPWIVSLQRFVPRGEGALRHFCAGSIVDERTVVTAAHCVWNKTADNILVLAGAINIYKAEDGQQPVKLKKIIVHPKYLSGNRAGPYDIAILQLLSPLEFTDRVGPISLPTPLDEPQNSRECKYAGWGNRFLISGLYYHPSDVLRTVSSRVISRLKCWASYLFVFRSQLDTAICTAAGPLRGSCQGDSGGSLACLRPDDTPFLAGVVSWGWFICGDGFHPDVATDVSLFLDFIKGGMYDPEQSSGVIISSRSPLLEELDKELD